MNGFMNMLDTLSKLRIHYTNLHTYYIYIYIHIYIYIYHIYILLCVWDVFIHLFREQNYHIRGRSDAPTALTPDTTVHTRLGGITRHIFFGKIEQMFGQAVKGSASRGLEGGARRRGWVMLGRCIARQVVCESSAPLHPAAAA